MITRIYGKVVLECDGDDCFGAILHTEEGDFESAMALSRERGWMSRRESDGWMHYCPNCVSAVLEE